MPVRLSSASRAMTRLLHDVWRIFFPQYCVVCGKRLVQGECHICTTCYLGLPFTRFRGERGNVVERLFWGLLPIERANSFLFYEIDREEKRVFFQLKYHNRPQVGRFFGRIMARDLIGTDFFEEMDVIIPLPLHANKQRVRGYNQSLELAKGVSDLTGLPVVSDAIARVVDNPTQTHLTVAERHENVRGAFRLLRPELVAGKHILLIDDVVTTNATLLSCGTELAKVAGVRISIMTLGLAGHHSFTARLFQDWRKEEQAGSFGEHP